MSNPKFKNVSSRRLREILGNIADDFFSATDRVMVALDDNSFNICVDGCSINITVNLEGGEKCEQ